MSAYLDLLSVANPRPTKGSRERQRNAANSRPLLTLVAEAFEATGTERLSTAALLAYLDDHYPGWWTREKDEAVRASYLAHRLSMHGVRLHKGTYVQRRHARGVWREDILNAINPKD